MSANMNSIIGVWYEMSAHPKGICLIINNEHFSQSNPPLRDRPGTATDKDRLFHEFSRLGFIVDCRNDLKSTDMVRVLKLLSDRDHSHYGCFVCCILSHGSLGKVYGVNGVAVDIQDLTSLVKPNSCPSLANKPKVFFVQACQGARMMEGYPPLDRDAVVEPPLVPNEADFLLCYSTVPGYETFRCPVSGSPFIKHLVRYMGEYAETEGILDILTMVNKAMGKEDVPKDTGGLYKMMASQRTTLRFKLVFGPATNRLETQPPPIPHNPVAMETDRAQKSKSGKRSPKKITGAKSLRSPSAKASPSRNNDRTLPKGWRPVYKDSDRRHSQSPADTHASGLTTTSEGIRPFDHREEEKEEESESESESESYA